ncbi:MAG TPA: iron ABC transporter permease [Nocardioidaceae bacterium]|nr:iron ABC transporter permease [Nocardioidaceae bacterium]
MRQAGRRGTALALGVALVATAVLASLALGARPVSLPDVVGALTDFDGSPDQIAVRSLRLPRTVVGLVVGLALGVAGAVMQGLTRNPVADPGLLGVSAGAALGLVVAVTLGGVTAVAGHIWFAFAGALVAAVTVYAVANRSRRSPITSLVLGGAAVSATLGSITSAVLVVDQEVLDQYRFWAVGSLVNRDIGVAAAILPFVGAGLLAAALCVRGLDALALGDDVARALGRNLAATRVLAGIAIVLLTGAAVAAAGPIAFIGLVIPHLVRPMVGSSHGWLLVASAVYAPALLVCADVLGRLLVRPGEVPAGVVTALLGAPFLIWLVRREHRPAAVAQPPPADGVRTVQSSADRRERAVG